MDYFTIVAVQHLIRRIASSVKMWAEDVLIAGAQPSTIITLRFGSPVKFFAVRPKGFIIYVGSDLREMCDCFVARMGKGRYGALQGEPTIKLPLNSYLL